MNKLEYLEGLIASGSNSTQVFEAARQYDIDNPVKINDTQTQDATAVSTNDASDTGSQSEDGSSASQPTVSPGQVLSRDDGFEYKYEIDPNDPNQGIYFSRQAGSEDEWTNANENTSEGGNVAKASIANLFGHSSFGEKEQKQYFDNLEKLKELKEAKKEATKQYQRDNELGVLGILGEGFSGETDDWFDWDGVRIFEGAARLIGETVEGILDVSDTIGSKFIVEPIAGALNYSGLMDLSDYEDDSWDGVNFDNVINNIITDYAMGEGAVAGAYGETFDFSEEVGDRIEAGMLDIASGMMAMPKLIADTKTMIGETAGKILPQGAIDFLGHPAIQATLFGPLGQSGLIFGQKDLVEFGESAYERFSKKSNDLNMTLMDFGEVGMTETLGKAFDGDATVEQRLGAFLTGGARITSSALGSLPSVAQSMIPYVGIASIVAGEAAKTNMESAKDGRPLDWARLGHSYVIGASEGLLELVTKKIGKGMFQGLRGGGKQVIQKSLLEYGTKVMKEFGQEGLSEVGTLLINQAADYVYKDEVDNFLPAWGEVIDTFMIGGVMGGGMSAAGVGGQLLNSTIQSRNIKNSMKISGDTSLSSMFDGSINPLSEGGLSTEIARGAEDSTVARERGPDGKPLAANEVMLKVKPDSGGSGNPLVDAKNVKPENIDAKQKTEGISETGFVDSKGNEQTETTNPLTSRKNIDENNTANANAKPVTDSKPTYTADERADAKHTVLTNPQTEMFLNTELKRKVASGEMTSTKAAEIKANFKAQQGVANRIAPIGYSGQDRQSVIKLSTERNQLTEKIKSVGDKSLTKPEQARIAEIDSQLETIPRTATQQGVINAQVEQDIAFTEKFGNIGKKDGEFKDFIGENKAVVTYNTTQEFMEATGSTDGNVDAFITPEGQIIINKQHMREAGAVGVGRHELLHKILKSQFSGKNGEKLKDQFLEVIKAQDPAGHKLLMDKINQIDPATGERVYSEQELKDAPDEYLAQYSSLLFEGKIPLETFVEKPTLVKKLGNFFSNVFADAANENPTGENVKASDIGFKDGKDLYDFVRAYAKDSESGKLSERSKQLAEQGKDINKSKNVKSKTVIKGDLDLKQKINNLVPSSVKTQQDFYNPKVFDKIYNDQGKGPAGRGKLHPLLQQYIRSKSSSGTQGDLNIRNVANRLMNFDPTKERASGKAVGANAFFEFITSNTNFGKKDSNKQLVEKAKDLKRSRSLDGDLDLQIEGDAGKINTSEAVEKLTDLRKKGVMKNISSEQVSELTTAIEQDIEGQDLTGKNYKNINPGQALANAWGKIFGLNPELLYQIGKPGTQKAGKDVSSKRSVAEGDNAAFAKLRTFLNANAQNLINVLPEGTTYDGKATGIPENVKNLFYTKNSKGKLVKRKNISPKEIKDAMAAPDGALYKSSQAQTIKGINKLFFKGLLNTTVTQSQLSKGKSPTEVAVNKEGSSKRAFSKTVTSTQNNQLTAIMALDGINSKGTANVTTYLRDKNLLTGDITVTESNRKARQLSVLESIKKGKIPGAALDLLGLGNFGAQRDEAANGDYYYTLDNGETIIGKATKVNGKQKYGAPRKNGKGKPKLFSRPTLESIEAAYPGEKVKLQAARGSLYYGKSDPAYETMMKVADANNSLYSPEIIDGFKSVQQIKIKKGEKLTRKQKKANKAQEDINQKALADFVKILDQKDGVKVLENGKPNPNYGELIIPLNDSALFVAQAYQGTASLIKISAPFVGVSDVFIKADPGTPQAKRSTDYIEEHSPPANAVGAAIIFGLATDTSTQIMKGVKDNFVQIQLSNHSDVRLDDAGLAKKLADGTNILTPNVGFLRLAEAGILTDSPIAINLNTIQDLNTGLDIATTMGYPLKGKFKTDPSSVKKQSQLMLEQARDPNIKFSRSVGRLNTYVNTVGAPIIQATKNNSNLFDGKVNTNMGIDQQIEVLENYDKTLKFSRSLNTKPKGISVFDFDDTLAKTKERVIVISPDGNTREISAAQFAEQAGNLQSEGNSFDFTNFDNVVNAKKGPLADLALKRQGKFGSKDIFVLTARPQIAATGIKAFLDGIGLNLPLKNITGLENGTPEAKANWVISKTAEGYNDFYFADDAIGNVKAVKNILDQVDVKSKVQQAKYSKSITFNKIFNNIIEESTGIESYKEYSAAKAQTVGANKGKWTFFTTPSAEDFLGLIYKLLGKGKVGDAQMAFFKTNLIDPYNRAEVAVTKAKTTAANSYKTLKRKLKTLPKSLSKKTGIGGFTFGQAARVAIWTRQGMEVPGLSKKDAKELNAFVEANSELDLFVNELIKIQKGKPYPKPGTNWLAGTIPSDIENEINKVNRKEYLAEWQENVDIIFSPENLAKLEAAYGPRYVEALKDQLRRMKSGSNRPVGGSRIVNQLLDWLNNSVGAIMFLNTKSAVLQTISAVNFINFGDNNIYKAGKAFANQKQYWKDFMTLFNSPYLVDRRDGLKINVSESEISDAVSESTNKPKAFLNLLLSKGFVMTRIADSFAIAAGGATFFRNRMQALIDGGMSPKDAEKQAFQDFYDIAETSQQSSNPSKISQQQASGAGRVILAFANTPMQYARIIKRATQDLVNGRGDWKANVSKIVYYAAMQNLIFNALQAALFSLAFDDEEDETDEQKQAKLDNKNGRIANGMVDSLLKGLGIQGALVATLKDALITIHREANKGKGAPDFNKAIFDLFGFSPPLDAKLRKLKSGGNTFSWERERMNEEGFNLNNPAYLAGTQVIAGLLNLPLDRAIQKMNNIRAIFSNSSENWQKVALTLGWSTWDVGLPYYGVNDKEIQTPQTILRDKVLKMKKETSGKEQKQLLLDLGLTKQEIVKLKYEEVRIKKIIELQNKKKDE